jgi:hypothetical protein
MNKGGPRAALVVNDFAQPRLDYITGVAGSGPSYIKANRGICGFPLCRAEITFLYDPFMRLASTLDSIFKLPVSLGQLRHYLVRPARGIAIEDGGLQHYASSEPKFMLGLMRRNRRRN